VEGASQIVAMAHEQGLTPCWMGGTGGCVFWPILVHERINLCPLSLDTEGSLTIKIDELAKHQPFGDALKWSELLEWLSRIPGVILNGESRAALRAAPVNVPRSVLGQDAALREILSTVKWLIDQIKRSNQAR
jgi:hypothetical protein